MIIPVILAGGSGSRLWPLSRTANPKQFLPLAGERTMLQETVLRTQGLPGVMPPVVICNQEHRFLVAEQLQMIGIKNATIILEPVGKNTAPAAAIAALYHQAQDPTLLVLPADHLIKHKENFTAIIEKAIAHAQSGKLVTFGVVPTHAETGYGYIKTSGHGACTVEQFVEKPDSKTAQAYLASGQYYWNSGMFMFRASQFLAELKEHAPDILQACSKAISGMSKDLDFVRLDKEQFAACPGISIDYAVMEKTSNSVLIPFDTAWSDVGSWSALYDIQDADENGNVLLGDVIVEETNNSYLRAESRMLATVGVKDHVVVETPDVVLVAHKDYSQDIKKIVTRLSAMQRQETDFHRRVYRPWGHYEVLALNDHFQVKRITITPGSRLSLQMHHHRSEHWVVVSGQADVTRGDETFSLAANESTYIPCTVKHRLANTTSEPLIIIEVQLGDYLGEDDIVRFEDSYGRA